MQTEERLFESFLAKLYTDLNFKTEFTKEPILTAKNFGLNQYQIDSLDNFDFIGLELAFNSLEAKRNKKKRFLR